MGWTDDGITTLRQLFDQGLSTGQIGALMQITRNAVIGKIHRMGLQRERTAPFHRATPKKYMDRAKKADRFIEQPQPGALPDEPEHPPEMIKCSLMDLTPRSCRFPIGSPGKADFFFCGNTTDDDKLPYCNFHTRVAYSAPRAPAFRPWDPDRGHRYG